MNKYLALAAALCGLTTCALANENYTLDPAAAVPVFEFTMGPLHQRGHFKQATGKAVLDLDNQKGSVDFTVSTRSLDMGSGAWNEHVTSEGLFNVAKFPSLEFKSDKLVFDAGKVVGAEGQFTMLGVTHPLRVAVSRFACGNHPLNRRWMCTADITGTIRRSDYGLDKYLPAVSDEVQIFVPVEAYKD